MYSNFGKHFSALKGDIKDYENLILGSGDPVELIGGVFMEAVAAPDRRIDEAKWV